MCFEQYMQAFVKNLASSILAHGPDVEQLMWMLLMDCIISVIHIASGLQDMQTVLTSCSLYLTWLSLLQGRKPHDVTLLGWSDLKQELQSVLHQAMSSCSSFQISDTMSGHCMAVPRVSPVHAKADF